jgi:hypothetical protein
MKPLIYILCLLFFSCSGVDLIDDYVPPTLRISNAVDELPIGSSFELRASYFNNVESMIIGGEMAFQIGKKWGVSASLTQPLFGKVIFKATTYSGGIFFNL